MTRKVLVTGGAGFIGSHLVDQLVARGDEVTVLDCLFPQVHQGIPRYVNPKAHYVWGDVRDADAVSKVLPGQELLYHLAAWVGVGQSMYRINDYVEANTRGTAALLERVIKSEVRRLVVASSMSIYGEGPVDGAGRPLPTPETHPLRPPNVYAITKRDQEELCLTIGKAYGIPSVALRFFNTYGPRQSLSNPYTGVAAIFLSAYKNGQAPRIFDDGQQSRDFVHVSDVVQSLLLAGDPAKPAGVALNVGTGVATSILRVAELTKRETGSQISPNITGEHRKGDIRHCIADISKIRETMGYQPRVSLEQGLRELVLASRDEKPENKADAAYAELKTEQLLQR